MRGGQEIPWCGDESLNQQCSDNRVHYIIYAIAWRRSALSVTAGVPGGWKAGHTVTKRGGVIPSNMHLFDGKLRGQSFLKKQFPSLGVVILPLPAVVLYRYAVLVLDVL